MSYVENGMDPASLRAGTQASPYYAAAGELRGKDEALGGVE